MLPQLFAAWASSWSVFLSMIVGTAMVLPFIVLPRGTRERYSIVGASVWAWLVIRLVLLVRVRQHGKLNIRDGSGAILICNHRSWLDPVLLIAYGRAIGLSKRSILYLPVIGLYGYLAGAVFFDRRDKDQRAKARSDVLKLVQGGHRLVVFPEGTRSKDGEFAERVFLSLPKDAWKDGLPVVPCAVLHTERVLPIEGFVAHPFKEVDLVFGETLYPEDFEDEASFATTAWARVRELAMCARSGT